MTITAARLEARHLRTDMLSVMSKKPSDRRPLIVMTDRERYEPSQEEHAWYEKMGADFAGVRSWAPEDELIEGVRLADIVWVWGATMSRRVIQSLERCRIIVYPGSGYDKIDLAAAKERRIPVTYNPTFCVDDISDHALGLILAALHRIPYIDSGLRAGHWRTISELEPMHRLSSRTVGIIGLGRIGTALARKLKPWGMPVLGYSRSPASREILELGVRQVSLDELLENCNVISLHVPLTPQTYHIVDSRFISRMRPDAIVVNTSRGKLVDEKALIDALERRTIAGAALDVYEHEPLESDSPLLRMDHVVVTSHTGNWTVEALKEQREQAIEEIRRSLLGLPPLCLIPGQ